MRRSAGFSLIEVLIASIILALVVGGSVASYVSIKQLSGETVGYRYVALNLAREILEAGETGFIPMIMVGFPHPFRLKYYYAPATVNTLPEVILATGSKCGVAIPGTDGTRAVTGYGLKEWRCFYVQETHPADGFTHPFTYLGDIETKGLVPKGAPHSVTIYYYIEKIGVIDGIDYEAHDNSDSNDPYKQTVEITWQDAAGGETKREVLSNIPIRKINDQLKLETTDFSWD